MKKLKIKTEDQGTPDTATSEAGQKETGANFNVEMLAEALSKAGLGAKPDTSPAPQKEAPLYEQIGIGKDRFDKMREELGETAFGGFVTAMQKTRQDNENLVLALMDKMESQFDGLNGSITEMKENVNSMGSNAAEHAWAARGYDVFAENEDATKEYLESKSNDVVDMTALYNDAVDKNDYAFLDKVRDGLQSTLTTKDHTSLGGSSAQRLSPSEQEQQRKEAQEKEDAIEAARNIQDPVERLKKFEEIGYIQT